MGPGDWIVANVRVEVGILSIEAEWVFADELSSGLIIISGAVVIEPRFRIKVTTRIAEWIEECAGRGGLVAERIEG
jgi:hypothetical protein